MIVAEVYPFGIQHRCTSCGCHVDPQHHTPGSAECAEARTERDRATGQ